VTPLIALAGEDSLDRTTEMATLRYVAISIVGFVLFAGLGAAQDLSSYRDFRFGATLEGSGTQQGVATTPEAAWRKVSSTPTFSPAAGAYSSTQSVTISTSTSGCSRYIYWNTTGNPTSGDTQGTSVSVASSETVYARVIGCPGYSDSAIRSAAYTITSSRAATPRFSPAAGAYSSTQSVTISTSTPGCSGYIYWNTTGNPTSGDTHGTSVSVASSETVYARVISCPGHSNSFVGSAAYTITSSQAAATPTFSPAAGTYSSAQSVTISTSTPGCSGYIYWNTTGNPTSSATRGTSVSVAASETVYAKVIGCPGYSDSAVSSAAYTITSSQAAMPTFSPTAGTYSSSQSVTMSTSTPGCSGYIYWNTTGNPTSGATRGTSVSVASSETVYAKVIGCPGYSDSAIRSAAYTITSSQAAPPTFSPTAGTYSSSQSVTMSTSTPGCSGYIYWNTTGNPTSGDTQGTSVSVASSETVYARAIGCPGYSDSAVSSAAYTITSSQAATPTFSPTAGAYSSTQSVTIAAATPGCSGYIYWNTTGNPTSGDTQGTSVSVASSETVYAKVIGCPGYSDSAVGSAAYTMTSGLPTLVQDVAWGVGGQTATTFKFHLPNSTLGGSSTQGDRSNNLLICGVSWDGTGTTATITDNNSNSWTNGPSSNDGTRMIALKYALGAKAGTQDLTLTLSAAQYNVHMRCSEFYNVATSSAVDGTATSASNITGPTVASGSISTTVDNDLIYYYGIDDGYLCCTSAVTSFVVGTNFKLLPSDRHIGHFAQYQVQTTHGAINPTMTVNQSSHDTFGAAAIALRAASAGTAPGAAIRIKRVYHTSLNAGAYTVQFPCDGNLIVTSTAESTAQNGITSITDSNSNTFKKVSAPATYPQMFYAGGATCTNPNTRTMTFSNANSGVTSIAVIYDITGANTSPYDTSATSTGDQVSTGGSSCTNSANSNSTLSVTPSTANGLIIAVENNGTGPECGMSGAGNVLDSEWYFGQDDSSTGLMDSSSGYAHMYNSSTAVQTFIFNWANAGISGWESLAVAFKGQ